MIIEFITGNLIKFLELIVILYLGHRLLNVFDSWIEAKSNSAN